MDQRRADAFLQLLDPEPTDAAEPADTADPGDAADPTDPAGGPANDNPAGERDSGSGSGDRVGGTASEHGLIGDHANEFRGNAGPVKNIHETTDADDGPAAGGGSGADNPDPDRAGTGAGAPGAGAVPDAGAPGAGHTGRRGTIDIRIDLGALIGLTNEPAHIPGWGPITADIARSIALEPTAEHQWRYTITHPNTGAILANGLTKRRPNTRQTQWVTSRNPVCIFPGCRTPATSCDLDHTHPHSQGGPTLTQNLAPLCRHDHQVKHTPGWTLTTQPHGYTWTTPHHHTYTTNRDNTDGDTDHGHGGGSGDGSDGSDGRDSGNDTGHRDRGSNGHEPGPTDNP